jgi:cation diffusion facilitator family transporter
MKKRKEHGDFNEFILLVLLKEKELSLEELEEKISLFVSYFSLSVFHFFEKLFEKRPRIFRKVDLSPENSLDKWKKRDKKVESMEFHCKKLIKEGTIRKNKNNKYELTDTGKYKAEKFKNDLEKGARIFENQFQSPEAATRNTFIVNVFLTIIKLSAGFLSGSVGLLADGADAFIDTISAAAVWFGMRTKRELLGIIVIIIMMFVTGVSVGVESVSKLVGIFSGTITPITHPWLVIVVEAVAMIIAVILTLYQRYIGKLNGSFALISQSIDSKNHIFVACAVILGVILSIFGLHFVDIIIGVYISYRILKDAFQLTKEALVTIKGEEVNLDKYKYPFEEHWHLSKLESFKLWILYTIRENGIKSREEIINSLKQTFDPEYIPVFSEFKFSLGKGFDFSEKFDTLTEPLLESKLVIEDRGEFFLSREGEKYLDKKFNLIRYQERK